MHRDRRRDERSVHDEQISPEDLADREIPPEYRPKRNETSQCFCASKGGGPSGIVPFPFIRRYYSREHDIPFHEDITFSLLLLPLSPPRSPIYLFIVPGIFVAESVMAIHPLALPSNSLPARHLIPRSRGRNFSFSVVRQKYEVQVRDAYVLAGNTGVLRCEIPAFVKEYVAVTSWLKDSAFNIYPSAESGECNYKPVDPRTYMRTKCHGSPGRAHPPNNDGCRTPGEKWRKRNSISALLPDVS